MHCPTCQAPRSDSAPFCGSCGTPFHQACGTCGNRNEPGSRFCVECGTRLTQTGKREGRELPSSIVDPANFQPEKKLVTVLFADIVGSTKLIEHLDPDDAATQLHGIIATMRDGIRRFGGAVNKLQGDGVMAIFGAPTPQEDHAVRACCAALVIRDTIEQANDVKIRIGIHTGEAVVQEVRNDLSSQYEAMGVAVHIAARAEQVANPSQIVITDTTLRSARELVEVEPLGPRMLKGLSQPVELFTLDGIRSAAASQQFLGGQVLSSFVARVDELSALREFLDRALSGSSEVVGICGEPGVGKSRLAFEFANECHGRNIPVVEARATAHGQPTPLQPILDLLRSFLEIPQTASDDSLVRMVDERLGRFGLSAETPHIAEFLGITKPAARSQTKAENAPVEVIRRVCRALGRQFSALVLFEDVHWLDEASEPFLEALVDGFGGSGILLLLNFRPGFHRDWMKNPKYHQVDLKPLSRSAIDRIAGEVVGLNQSTAELRSQIADRAGGNPFFAEEIMRALLARKALTGDRGNYNAAQPGAATLLPDTVRGVISFRIDRLDELQKKLLEAASVVGREFPLEVAAEIAGMDRSTAQTQIDGLLDLEMIYSAAQGGLERLAFKHPLVQEVAYASLVSERKKSLHRRAAKSLGTYFSRQHNEHAALIARHWEEGDDPVQAASNYMASATWMGMRDPVQAVRMWKHVRDLTVPLPPDGPGNFMRLMACGQIINLSWRENAALDVLEPVYQEARSLAVMLKDARAGALLTMAYGRALLASGSADDYLSSVKQAQEILLENPNPSVAALLLAVESHATAQSGFLRKALLLNAAALKNVDRIDAADQRMLGFNAKHWLTTLRARYLMQTDDPVGSDLLINELLNETAELDLTHRVMALGIRIDSAALDRDAPRASAAAGELESATAQSASPYIAVLTDYFIGIALLVASERTEAESRLRKALKQAHRDRAGLELEPLMLANLSDCLSEDRSNEAIDIADRAQASAQRRSQRVAELFAVSSRIRAMLRARKSIEAELSEELGRLVAMTGAQRLGSRASPAA